MELSIGIKFDYLPFRIHLPSLYSHLQTSLPGFEGISTLEDGFYIHGIIDETNTVSIVSTYLSSLSESSEEQKFLPSQAEQVALVVRSAVEFGNQLIISFATENVLMGITQAGKTKAVADYLRDVMRYAQTGSLYEVINEVDSLIASGIPSDLSPFITDTRLTAFKQKIITYLMS